MKRKTLIAALIVAIFSAQSSFAVTVYDKARRSIEGTKKLEKGVINISDRSIKFVSIDNTVHEVAWVEVKSMEVGTRKKTRGGATAAAVILAGPVGFAMLAAKKKFTMLSIETEDDILNIGVPKKSGQEFLRRVEKASDLEVE